MEYNMAKLERYIFGQAGPSLFTYLATHTVQEFLNEVKKKEFMLNPKQKNLIELNQGNKTDDWQYKVDRAKMLQRWKEIYRREEGIRQRERELGIGYVQDNSF